MGYAEFFQFIEDLGSFLTDMFADGDHADLLTVQTDGGARLSVSLTNGDQVAVIYCAYAVTADFLMAVSF